MHSGFFLQKTKKNLFLFRYLGNYVYFCPRKQTGYNSNNKIKKRKWQKL